MPARVEEQFQAEQYQSEILIGWVQAVGVVLFAFVYFLSPEELHVEERLQPVPIALGLYGCFVALRLFLAYRNRLTRAVTALSIIVDVALLLAVIATIPIMHEAPAALYLKHTGQAYLFVIVALRVLRFEPGWVVLASLAAAVGWLIMVVFAVIQGGMGIVTFDPARYFTEPVVLPAAEFDHIAALILFGIVLAVAVARARNLFLRAVGDAIAVRELGQFFAPHVAKRIATAEIPVTPGTAEERQAAIVFFDIRGFTILARRMTPSEQISLLGDYHGLVVPIVDKHGGSIDKFLGDGVLVSFGAVEPTVTYAADALRAVKEVLEKAGVQTFRQSKTDRTRLQIGAGIATGTILFGTIGFGRRLEHTVLGDPVNLAAKLEKHNKIEGSTALATAAAYELARNQGFEAVSEILPARQLEGIDEPLDLAVIAS